MMDLFADCLHIMTCIIMIGQVTKNDTDVCYTSQHLLTISTYFRNLNLFEVRFSNITFIKSVSILLSTIISIKTRNKNKNKLTIFSTLLLCIAFGIILDQLPIIIYISRQKILNFLQLNILNSLWYASFCIEIFSALTQLCHMKKKGSVGIQIANYIVCFGFYKLFYVIHWFVSPTNHVIVFISGIVQIALIIVSFFIHRQNKKIKIKNDQMNLDV